MIKEVPTLTILYDHDDVIKWKHFPRDWPFLRGIRRSPVNSTYKGQWRGHLMFSLVCNWIKVLWDVIELIMTSLWCFKRWHIRRHNGHVESTSRCHHFILLFNGIALNKIVNQRVIHWRNIGKLFAYINKSSDGLTSFVASLQAEKHLEIHSTYP